MLFSSVHFLLAADDIECASVTLNDTFTWQTDDPYMTSECVIAEAEAGYLVLVTINKCDISGNDGDYLLLKPGKVN